MLKGPRGISIHSIVEHPFENSTLKYDLFVHCFLQNIQKVEELWAFISKNYAI